MEIIELRAIGELVGGIAVIESLVSIGLQIRQNAAATRAGTALEASRMYEDLHGSVLQTPDLGHIFLRGHEDFEALADEEKSRFPWLLSQTFPFCRFDSMCRWASATRSREGFSAR